MLLTFFTVIAVDLVAVSLLTHKLRVWFPVWLDAHWATRTDPWVVYSQSYFAVAASEGHVRGRFLAGFRRLGYAAHFGISGLISSREAETRCVGRNDHRWQQHRNWGDDRATLLQRCCPTTANP